MVFLARKHEARVLCNCSIIFNKKKTIRSTAPACTEQSADFRALSSMRPDEPEKPLVKKRRRWALLLVASVVAVVALYIFMTWSSEPDLRVFPISVQPQPAPDCPAGFPPSWAQDKGGSACQECTTLTLARDVCGILLFFRIFE